MMKKMYYLCLLPVFLLFCIFPLSVHAQESNGNEDITGSPYFVIEGEYAGADSLPLKKTKVSSTVNGAIADTYVTQTYENEGKGPINASYVFPASTKVSVHGMTMQIGDKTVTAKIKEKKEAAEEFEEAKSEGKSASLLEQQRPNVFSMSVANIMPGDVVNIELHYTEMIVTTEGVSQFVFPTVVGPRYVSPGDDTADEQDQWAAVPYLREGESPAGSYEITVKLSTGVPVSEIKSKSHKISVKKEGDSEALVTLSNPNDYAGDRDFILDYKLTGQQISSGLLLNQGADENFFMLTVQPPKRVETKDIPKRDYIFVLDVSGSMYGYPLDTAKVLIRDLVKNLRETDTFNVILFSGSAMQMSAKSVPATSKNVKEAIDLIDQQDGGGATELAEALKTAIDLPREGDLSRSVVVISDGFVYGEDALFDLIRTNLNNTDFFSFGIGSSVNRFLIDGVARAGQGEAFVVTNEEDASETAKRFRTYIQSPILTDIQVSYDGFDVYDVEPARLPTLFAQRPIVLFGKWKGELKGTIQITGKTGQNNFSQTVQVNGTIPAEDNEAIRYLWARTKVDRLLNYGCSSETEAVRSEVTALGLNYSMLTPFTSFIAVVEEVRNPDQQSTDVKQPSPLPSGVSDYAVGTGYVVGSEPELLLFVPVLLLAVTAGCYIRRRKYAALHRIHP